MIYPKNPNKIFAVELKTHAVPADKLRLRAGQGDNIWKDCGTQKQIWEGALYPPARAKP
jgi:hypothetical protein